MFYTFILKNHLKIIYIFRFYKKNRIFAYRDKTITLTYIITTKL